MNAPTPERRAAEGSAAKRSATENPAAESSTPKNPAPESPTPKNPVAERSAPDDGAVGRPMPNWARIAGWLSLLLPLPAIIWRLLMLVGVDVGFAQAETIRSSFDSMRYVLTLEILSLIVAVLCFGLIRPWSERVPRWLPGAGRVIPMWLPLGIGIIGWVILTYMIGSTLADVTLTGMGLADGWRPYAGMSPAQGTLLAICYIPFFCWPIAIAVTLAGYWVRRQAATASAAMSAAKPV